MIMISQDDFLFLVLCGPRTFVHFQSNVTNIANGAIHNENQFKIKTRKISNRNKQTKTDLNIDDDIDQQTSEWASVNETFNNNSYKCEPKKREKKREKLDQSTSNRIKLDLLFANSLWICIRMSRRASVECTPKKKWSSIGDKQLAKRQQSSWFLSGWRNFRNANVKAALER